MKNELNTFMFPSKSSNQTIENLIYTIRGLQVMLDKDVALLYNCETKYINRIVKRNISRFPQEYCFQLSEKEYESLRCQFVTLKKNGRGQHRKYMPYVFTEHGITMLAGLLNSEIAINVSIKIINTFISMRKFLYSHGQIFERLTNLEYKQLENEKHFQKLFNMFEK